MSASAADTPARVAALIALYRESQYEISLPRGVVTVRVGASAPPPILRWIGSDGTAFYLTACNPRSTSLPIQPFTIVSGTNLNIDTDFPRDSFF